MAAWDKPVSDTLYFGNVDETISERVIAELCLQAGPVRSLRAPVDASGRRKTFVFVQFAALVCATVICELLSPHEPDLIVIIYCSYF